jgi:hypothetical protein
MPEQRWDRGVAFATIASSPTVWDLGKVEDSITKKWAALGGKSMDKLRSKGALRERLREQKKQNADLLSDLQLYTNLIFAIQAALATNETGDDLVSVARAAHQAELVMSKITNMVDTYNNAGDWANLPDKDFSSV